MSPTKWLLPPSLSRASLNKSRPGWKREGEKGCRNDGRMRGKGGVKEEGRRGKGGVKEEGRREGMRE